MRSISEIIVHCTATPADRHVTTTDVDKWHRQRGFNSIGYHYLIYLDGSIHRGRDIKQIGAHCLGHNANSIGVCYVGGLDHNNQPLDTRTTAQRNSLLKLLRQLKTSSPKATIHGHRDFAAKECPCFDATAEYSNIK